MRPGFRRIKGSTHFFPTAHFLYPQPPILYLLLIGWTLIGRPTEGLFSLAIISLGLVFYFMAAKGKTENTRSFIE